MAAIRWNESLSVKVDSLDKQHQKLFEMINEFYDNISKRSNEDLISKLVKDMKTYTLMHFNMEEGYMKRCNCPNFEQHQKEHAEFINKVSELEERLKNGTTIVSFEITNFLKNWIKKHILERDKKYSDCLLKHGIS